jgi:DNA primase
MESHEYVLGLLESVFGTGKRYGKNFDYAFSCPFCNHKNPKLIVNVRSGQYNCWTCQPPTKGRTPVSLLVKFDADKDTVLEMKGYFKDDNTKIDSEGQKNLFLPKEFISFVDNDGSLEYRRAAVYLKKRGVESSDVLKYNIGYCKSGRYRNMIIVPSYNKEGKLNYFVARSFEESPKNKYDSPSTSKSEIIGMEYFINWHVPVILCEGAFDAVAIKRNAIPLFGKTIPKALMLKLVESQVKTVYLALDRDALKEALVYSQTLLNHGKEVYLIELDGKDPSDIGFERMTQLLQRAAPLTFTDLLIKKLQMAN